MSILKPKYLIYWMPRSDGLNLSNSAMTVYRNEQEAIADLKKNGYKHPDDWDYDDPTDDGLPTARLTRETYVEGKCTCGIMPDEPCSYCKELGQVAMDDFRYQQFWHWSPNKKKVG